MLVELSPWQQSKPLMKATRCPWHDESIPHPLSCCHNHSTCINPCLKIVPDKCIMSSCCVKTTALSCFMKLLSLFKKKATIFVTCCQRFTCFICRQEWAWFVDAKEKKKKYRPFDCGCVKDLWTELYTNSNSKCQRFSKIFREAWISAR